LFNPGQFSSFGQSSLPKVWISFAPIWLFASFFEWLALNCPERLNGIRGIIACSSSSAITKRFAFNRFDRQLVDRLVSAEDRLIAASTGLELPCKILRPAIIYGQVGSYGDRNISVLLRLMSRLPFLPIPAETGLRQPIHASQLASVALCLARQLSDSSMCLPLHERISVGGDVQLSYTAMLQSLQRSLPANDSARRCRLLPIPNRLFYIAAAPVLLYSLKIFEAVLRMSADLNDFSPAHRLIGENLKTFPVVPLAR
jgi:nucleoside-diphosphate-sugar epimerase